MPVSDIIEWLAEWSRDTRGEQRGLLLLTAHRAKGLEFDHVVILNGGWNVLSKNEDPDAPRRLFYVAMTRAQKSLAVMTTGEHALLKGSCPALLRRELHPLRPAAMPVPHIYQLPDLKLSDLSFAGRQGDRHEVHEAIRRCKVGDPLQLEFRAPHWVFIDQTGSVVGRMSKAWQHPQGYVFLSGRVGAVVRWRKSDGDEKYAEYLRRDVWETVLPELVFVSQGAAMVDDGVSDSCQAPAPPLISPSEGANPTPPQTGAVHSPQDIEPLAEFARRAFADSRSWAELISAFDDYGVTIEPKSGGLILKDRADGHQICKLSQLGLRYMSMIQHYGEGFPDHPVPSLVERALNGADKGPSDRADLCAGRRHNAIADNINLIDD